MDYNKIGKFIAQLRKEYKYTQDMLAEKLYVDRTVISKWENGNYIPNPELLLLLSEIFDLSINEILAGERITEENKDKINEVPIEILKDNRKKAKTIKTILLSSIITLVTIVVGFLSLYFINNYNSIKVYKLGGNGNNFFMNDGLIVTSREKAYIRLGIIDSKYNKAKDFVRLYYIDNEKEIDLISGDKSEELLINVFGKDELFSYNELKNIRDNLYLEIAYSNGEKEIIKLESKRDFSNIKIFSDSKPNINIKDEEKIDIDNNVPDYIVNNFKYDSSENKYYLKSKYDDKTIEQKYFLKSNMYIVEEFYNDNIIYFEYIVDDATLIYKETYCNELIDNFSYKIDSKECIFKNCNFEKINYFINTYLKNLDLLD